jgi:hypothetical protein
MKSKSPIITGGAHAMIKNGVRPVHPGEILLEEFMKPSEPPINANMFAKALDVPGKPDYGDYQGTEGNYG